MCQLFLRLHVKVRKSSRTRNPPDWLGVATKPVQTAGVKILRKFFHRPRSHSTSSRPGARGQSRGRARSRNVSHGAARGGRGGRVASADPYLPVNERAERDGGSRRSLSLSSQEGGTGTSRHRPPDGGPAEP